MIVRILTGLFFYPLSGVLIPQEFSRKVMCMSRVKQRNHILDLMAAGSPNFSSILSSAIIFKTPEKSSE